jgi:hypothetical protein
MSYIGKTPTSVPLTSSDITDGIISLPKLTDGTDGNLISYDASGNPVAVATGTRRTSFNFYWCWFSTSF